MSEKISYYFWRIKILLCYFKHDWKNVYTRIHVGGETDGYYSGKNECQRCYEHEYFSGFNNKELGEKE